MTLDKGRSVALAAALTSLLLLLAPAAQAAPAKPRGLPTALARAHGQLWYMDDHLWWLSRQRGSDGYYYVEVHVDIACDATGRCRIVRERINWDKSWKIVYPTGQRRNARPPVRQP